MWPPRIIAALLLLVAACGDDDPPPGEVLGTFAFVADLDESEPAPGEVARCVFDGAPDQITFDGTLSHDRQTGDAWLQIDGTLREGTLGEAAFTLDLPPEPDGSVRGVPRRLAACTCDLLFVETISGSLVPRATAGCRSPPTEEPIGPTTCPRLDEEGALSWDTCGGICGTLREAVHFPATGCTCEVAGLPEPAPEAACHFNYRLRATRIGN